MLRRQIALIGSMTKKERANPDLLAASRKKRVAAGAGLEVAELNKLIKQHRQMADVMKRMGKGGGMKAMIRQMMAKGGMPDPSKMTPEQLAETAKGMQQGMGGLGGLGGGIGGGMGLPRGAGAAAGAERAGEEAVSPRPDMPSVPVIRTERLVLRGPGRGRLSRDHGLHGVRPCALHRRTRGRGHGVARPHRPDRALGAARLRLLLRRHACGRVRGSRRHGPPPRLARARARLARVRGL